jgi:RNA polymerase sigma-70 factor (ECF subfamily)
MINELPKQAGLVFRLHKVDGLTYKQIAEVLELSTKTVENHMGRALKIMRNMFSSKPDFFKE